jgi:hypothetical protein
MRYERSKASSEPDGDAPHRFRAGRVQHCTAALHGPRCLGPAPAAQQRHGRTATAGGKIRAAKGSKMPSWMWSCRPARKALSGSLRKHPVAVATKKESSWWTCMRFKGFKGVASLARNRQVGGQQPRQELRRVGPRMHGDWWKSALQPSQMASGPKRQVRFSFRQAAPVQNS